MTASIINNSVEQQCQNRACDCFATAKIFERRARRYRRGLSWLSYLGIGVPAILGAVVATWGVKVVSYGLFFTVAGILGVIQVGLSVVSLIQKWPDELEYCNESAGDNFRLSDDFKLLALTATSSPAKLQEDFAALVQRDQARSMQDTKRHPTQKEISWGHRHGLRQFGRACAKCNEVPYDMKPSSCTLCGDFK